MPFMKPDFPPEAFPPHALAAPSHPSPYPWYAALVAGPPLVFDTPRGLWLASSARAVQEVLDNPACRVRPLAEPVPPALAGSAAGEVFGQLVRMNEGVRHDAPKLALQRFLAAADLGLVRARTGALARQRAGGAPLRGPALSGWVMDVPVMAVADMLGFADAELPQVAHWMADFVACFSPLSTPARLAAASDAAAALLARLAELVRTAAARPESAVARLQQEAARAGWHDAGALLANLVGLLSQTHEATAGLVGNSIVALATQLGLLPAVRREPERLLAMVHEVSRYDPSIHNTRRFVAEATCVAGTWLRPGDVVLLVLAAAGRDPLCNPRPDEFILERTDRNVPGFGRGAHQCPGRALACTIAASALQVLLSGPSLLPDLPAHWHYRESTNARMPVFTA